MPLDASAFLMRDPQQQQQLMGQQQQEHQQQLQQLQLQQQLFQQQVQQQQQIQQQQQQQQLQLQQQQQQHQQQQQQLQQLHQDQQQQQLMRQPLGQPQYHPQQMNYPQQLQQQPQQPILLPSQIQQQFPSYSMPQNQILIAQMNMHGSSGNLNTMNPNSIRNPMLSNTNMIATPIFVGNPYLAMLYSPPSTPAPQTPGGGGEHSVVASSLLRPPPNTPIDSMAQASVMLSDQMAHANGMLSGNGPSQSQGAASVLNVVSHPNELPPPPPPATPATPVIHHSNIHLSNPNTMSEGPRREGGDDDGSSDEIRAEEILPPSSTVSKALPMDPPAPLRIYEPVKKSGAKDRVPYIPVATVKRIRHKASEITRDFRCTYPGCAMSYGTFKAAKNHVRLKHPSTFPSVPFPLPFPLFLTLCIFPMLYCRFCNSIRGEQSQY